jgi:hypothetical protein
MRTIRITGVEEGIQKIKHTRYLRDVMGVRFRIAKGITDDILEGVAREIEVSDERAEEHAGALRALGAIVGPLTTDQARSYFALELVLLEARALRQVNQADDAAITNELERLWWRLSEEERAEAEARTRVRAAVATVENELTDDEPSWPRQAAA